MQRNISPVPSSMEVSSTDSTPIGRVFKLNLSLMVSPGRFRVQNRDEWSLDPEQRMWPNGCQANAQIMLSCACSRHPNSFSVLEQNSMLTKHIQVIAKFWMTFWHIPHIPKHEWAIWSAWSKESLMNRVPRDTGCLFLVSSEDLNFLVQLSQIKEL